MARFFASRLAPWVIWGLSAVFLLYQFLLQTSVSVMVPEFMRSFSVDSEGLGFLSSSFFYMYLIFQAPSGMLVDKYGARLVLSVGVVLCVMAVWIFAHAQTLWVAEVSRIMMGCAASPALAATMYLAANWFSESRFPLVVGFTETAGMLGGVFGEGYLVHVVAKLGWRETLIAVAGYGMVLGVLIWVFVCNCPFRSSNADIEEDRCEYSHSVMSGLLHIMKMPQLWWNGFYAAMIFAVINGFAGLWCVPFLQAVYHLSLTQAAEFSSLIFLGVAMGGPILGWLVGRTGWFRRVMFYSTLVAFVIALHLIYTILPVPYVAVHLFLLGVFSGTYILPFAQVRHFVPVSARGTAMGLTNALCISVGALVLQPLIGYLLEVSESAVKVVGAGRYAPRDFYIALITLPICFGLAMLSVIFIVDQKIKREKVLS